MNAFTVEKLLIERGHNYGVKHFYAPNDGTIAEILEDVLGLKPQHIELILHLGAVYLNHVRLPNNCNFNVKKQDYVRVHTEPRRFATASVNISSLVLFENADFVVVNKPAGIPVHATVDNSRENLLTLVNDRFGLQTKITHRLDIPTSGLMVLAKNGEYQSHFNKLLRDGVVKKIYRAYVNKFVQDSRTLDKDENPRPLQSGIIVHYMQPSPRAPKTVSTFAHVGWQRCELEILNVKTPAQQPVQGDLFEVEVRLITGRTHQLRAQLSALGYPIWGDIAYGGTQASPIDIQALTGAPNIGGDWIALQCSHLSISEDFNFVL